MKNDPEIIKKLDESKWELSKTRIALGCQLVWIGVRTLDAGVCSGV